VPELITAPRLPSAPLERVMPPAPSSLRMRLIPVPLLVMAPEIVKSLADELETLNPPRSAI